MEFNPIIKSKYVNECVKGRDRTDLPKSVHLTPALKVLQSEIIVHSPVDIHEQICIERPGQSWCLFSCLYDINGSL